MIVPLKSLVRSFGIVNVRITPRRLLNLILIYLSMNLSRLTRRQIVWGYPLFLMVEPTNICNLKCPMCPSGNGQMSRDLGQLNFDDYRTLLDDMGKYVLQVQLWNQGEPLINRSFLQFVRYAKKMGIMTQTSTNGHFIKKDEQARELVESGLDQLIFSLDGTNAETYRQYRVGGNFNLVMESLERIARIKKELNSRTPLIELQFIVFRHNQNEIDELIALAKKLELNRISFKTAQVYSPDQAVAFLPSEEEFSRYRQTQAGAYEIKGEIKNWCRRLWLHSTVNWDGRVSPCCFDKDADYAFDNIFTNGTRFRETWKNSKYMAFRRQVMTDRRANEMCTNCTEGLPQPYTRIVEIDDL